jgi:hypothetical protein
MEHGGTTDGAEAIGRAEALAREYPDRWVYVEYMGHKGWTVSLG